MLTRDQLALAVVGAFLLANIVVPVLWGDIYPFTSGPMFRDAPTRYCNYRVYDPQGKLLDAETFLVQRIYDGNPVGYGVGVKPPSVLEEFGTERNEDFCRRHVLAQFSTAANRDLPYVILEQEVIGAVDGQHVGVLRKDSWRVENPNISNPANRSDAKMSLDNSIE